MPTWARYHGRLVLRLSATSYNYELQCIQECIRTIPEITIYCNAIAIIYFKWYYNRKKIMRYIYSNYT